MKVVFSSLLSNDAELLESVDEPDVNKVQWRAKVN